MITFGTVLEDSHSAPQQFARSTLCGLHLICFVLKCAMYKDVVIHEKKKSDFRCGFRWAEAASAGYIRHARRPVMKGLWITNALTGIQPAKIYSLFYKLLAAGPKLRGLPRRFRKMSFQIQPPIVAVLDPAPVECNRELDALIAIFVESRVASTCCTQLVT